MSDFKNYIGIDTGLEGGIALVDADGKAQWAVDMPTIEVERGGSTKRKYDVMEMARILKGFSPTDTFVTIEETTPRSSYIGGNSYGNWFLGAGFLVWVGMLIWASYRFVTVDPQVWQKTFFKQQKGMSKVNALRVASELFDKALFYERLFQGGPNKGKPKFLDGRVDAFLIAEYGRRKTLGLDPYIKGKE